MVPLASLIAVGLLLALAVGTAALPWIMPEHDAAARRLAAIAIFAASYAALAIGKVPGLSIDRAGVALVGACLMVASGVVPLDGSVPGRRSADHHPAARHDDRGRKSADLRLLRIGQRLGRATRASAIAVAGSHRRGLRRVLRVPRERRDLSGDGAAGAGADAWARSAIRCRICWPWRWHRMSVRRRR